MNHNTELLKGPMGSFRLSCGDCGVGVVGYGSSSDLLSNPQDSKEPSRSNQLMPTRL